MLKRIKKYFKRPETYIEFATGIGILAQAYFYIRVYRIELEGIFLVLPGLILVLYEGLIRKEKYKQKWFMNTWYWVTAIMLANIISILAPLFDK